MFSNYAKIAVRNLLRNKLYSIITISGLAVGIAATILIFSYIEFQLSFDNFQKDGGSIYRISIKAIKEGNLEFDGPEFVPPLGPAMLKDMPEVENYVRLRTPLTQYLSSGEQSMKVDGIVYADSTFFDLLSFSMLEGDPSTTLRTPYSIVLTPTVAVGLFGREDPLGKIVKINGDESFHVTGIVGECPANSSIRFKALISFSTLYHQPNMFLGWNGGEQYVTYVRLKRGVRPESVDGKFPQFMWQYINKDMSTIGIRLEPYLQPFQNIHLWYDAGSASIRETMYVLACIAFVILIIACVNFVNLTTARSARRAKEIGVRKVLGARKGMLIRQFLTESLIISFLGALSALLLAELLFPFYRTLIGEDTTAWNIIRPSTTLAALGVVLLVGLVAGSYPALHLSSFEASRTLKGVAGSGSKGRLRNILITLQFAVSIAMIVCTLVVVSQLHYLKNQNLGFDKNNIVVLPLLGEEAKSKSDLLKKELSGVPGVVGATASSEVPINDFTSNGYFPEGHNSPMIIHVVDVDNDFLKTFGIETVEGREFSKDIASDKSSYLINQTLEHILGWKNPLGRTIRRNGNHTVIGVVKDFNFATLRSPIEPLIITRDPWGGTFDNLSIKIRSSNIAETMRAIQAIWQNTVLSAPLSYWFLDESFEHLYRTEEHLETLLLVFAGLAIWIALMGLLSLAAFTTEERTKEIGIRKVLGASVPGVVGLLSRQFLKWVALANIVAWPAAYYFMTLWLQDFAYRVNMTVWPFIFGGLIALLLGWISVSAQTLKAALANPVNALRYE